MTEQEVNDFEEKLNEFMSNAGVDKWMISATSGKNGMVLAGRSLSAVEKMGLIHQAELHTDLMAIESWRARK